MTILGNITQIAASTSDAVWAVDADTNTVYRRNTVTKEFEKVPVNITVASLDVSADGYVVALNAEGKLFVWNAAETRFDPRAEGQTFDQISIGDGAVWAREADTGTLYLWDDDNGGFADAGFPGSAVSAFVAAKADDVFYVVDDAGKLWQYVYPEPAPPGAEQEPGLWIVLTDDLGVDNIETLVATRDEDLWALDADGEVYQLSTLNLADTDAPQTIFEPQSQKLGIGPLSDLTIDESGVLYGISDDKLELFQTDSAALQTYLGDKTSAVALGTDGAGVTHYAYSADGGVYHSYLRDGEWINAQFIPGSGIASEISIDFDPDDNIYISWIQSAGNGSEVFVAKGVKNPGYDGYTFSQAHQVTDDDVADQDLDMQVAPDGRVTLSVTKKDVLSKYDDGDIYQYTVDDQGTVFQRPSDIGVPAFVDDGKFIEMEPLQGFLTGDGGLGGSGISFVYPFTTGLKYKSPGKAFEMRLFVRGNSDIRGDVTEQWVGYEFVAGINPAGPFNFSVLKDFKISVLSDGRLSTSTNPQDVDTSLLTAGWRFNLDLNFAGPYNSSFTSKFTGKTIDVKWSAGIFGEFDFLWVVEELSGPLGGGQGSSFAIPIGFVDENGQPIDPDTPPSDIRAQFAPDDLARFAIASALPNLFGGNGTPPADDDPSFFNIFGQKQAWFAGIFLGGKLLGIEVKTRNGVQIGTEGTLTKGEVTTEVGFRSFGEIFIPPFFYARLWDLRIGGKKDADAFASVPVYGEFNTGGFTTVYDDGLVIKAEGTADTESDILDNDEFDYVFVSDDRVVGVYVQAEIDQADGSLNAINTINGTYDSDTGEIVWDLDSIVEVPGSKGYSFDPRIALGGEPGDPQLVITWAGVPPDNDELEALIDTPPGKAYVIFGGDVENKRIELADLRNGPAPVLNRDFFYTSADGTSLFGVGTSAALLGDVNQGTGQKDFIIGAPEAEQESGKAYIVFAEGFRGVANLDDGSDGINAINFLGERDSELGFEVGTAGDYNGDTIPDFAFSAPGADNHDGAVYVVYGGQDFSQVGGQGAPGQFTVDDIDNVLKGVKLSGPTDGGRWGTALAGGYDFTGFGGDDLAVGSVEDGTVTLVNAGDTPITIELFGDSAQQTNATDYGLGDIGAEVAMLPDINADGNADLLIGDDNGSAFVVFGGDDFRNYARNYVVSWDAAGDDPYKVVLSFFGEDQDGDGILSSVSGEISRLRMEVFEDGVLDFTYNTQTAFDLNYDLDTGQVLVNSTAASDPQNEVFNLSILPSGGTPRYEFLSVGNDPSIRLQEVINTGTLIVGESRGGNNAFASLSSPDSFDLQYLSDIPRTGFTIVTDAPLPLQVAEAGDIDGDGHQDFIVGFDQSEDEGGLPVRGESYVVFGGTELANLSGVVDLDELVQQGQAYNIQKAGGEVASAGDVNGDGVDDLLVSAPNDSLLAELSGQSYVLYGSQDIRTPGYVIKTGFILEDSNEFERSGASLTSLGDLNGDGFADFLVGASQAPDTDLAVDATEDAEILFSVRTPDDLLPGWTVGAPIDGGGDTSAPQDPLALAQTDLGLLAAWVSERTDGDGNTISTLYTSFYDGSNWSTPEAVGTETSNTIIEATITEVAITKSLSRPFIIWVESDGERTQTTTVFQSQYDGGWGDPAPVVPDASETPSPAGFNYISGETLVVGDESLSVEDVFIDEPKIGSVFASFIVTREGDTSQASGLYDFRLKDYGATYGLDFRGDHSGTFSFEAGQTTKEITVEIHADRLIERTESLRLEISSQDDGAFVSDNGLAVAGASTIEASLFVDDSNTVLNLTTIDSGFKLNGQPDVALGYAVNAAGDLNRDGIGDFMIAAPTAGPDDQGKNYVIYGQRGIAIDLQEFDLDTLVAKQGAILVGDEADIQVGTSLAYGLEKEGAVDKQPFVVVGAPGDAGLAGRVYVVASNELAGPDGVPNEITLDETSALVLTFAGEDGSADSFGRAVTVADMNNVGGDDDLIVTAGDAIYVIYDVLSQGLKGSFVVDPENSPFEVSKIVNGAGNGFGNGLAVTDLDGDDFNDLIVGSAAGNPLVNQFGLELGVGGFAAVIRGSETGLDTDEDIDVNALGNQGIKLLGQAAFTPTEGNAKGDPNNPGGFADNSGPLSGTPLLDGIGNAIAAVDLNGDGKRDLVLGAPLASIADADGQQSFSGANAGRVYVLFAGGGAFSDWSVSNYQLTDLYGTNPGQSNRFRDGIILEGTEAGGYAGTSLTNVGFFRGLTDQTTNIEDLGIGAPAANATAGQAYIVFGSEINYSNITQAGDNVFKIDPQGGTLPVFTYQGPAALLDEGSPPTQAAVGFDVAGLGDINALEFGDSGGTEFGIGAPFSNVDGVGQTYIATGHSWIVPGQSLEVEDLRSDNGFITSSSGATISIGDFVGNGYDDYLLIEAPDPAEQIAISNVTLVRGASVLDIEAAIDREISLDVGEGVFGQYITAGDFNGDGSVEIVALIDPGIDGQRTQTALYTADALADPATTTLSPTPITAPANLANFIGPPFEVGNFYSPDLNGDGLDDLFVTRLDADTNARNSFALGTDTLGVFGDQFDRSGDSDLSGIPLAIADLNGDGRDDVVLANNTENPAASTARILTWSDATQQLEVVDPDFDWASLGGNNPYAFDRQNIFQASSAGDVNGDGYDDVVISFLGNRNSEVPELESTSIIVYGAQDFDDISGTVLYPGAGARVQPSPTAVIPRRFADIVGDINGDGFDDVLVSQNRTDQDAFMIYGRADLPAQIVLPQNQTADFEAGFRIRGFDGRETGQPYLVSAAGDVNGDGLGDFILSDDSVFDLTFTVYGERDDAGGNVAALQSRQTEGVDAARTEIIDGTSENDYIVQSQTGGIVSVLAKEGDDIVLTKAETQILAYLGQGDDKIGIGDVDSSAFLKIDGGNGFDTLFFNESLGELNSLDLTRSALKGKVTGFEVIDLGVRNSLTLDVVSLKEVTGSGNTLLVRGEEAKLNLKQETDGSWENVGTNTHDGVIYDVYQFIFDDQFQFDETPTSNLSVWVEQDGVSFNDLQAGTDGRDWLKGTKDDDNIFGDAGRDFIFGRHGNDTLDGGEDRDFLSGGRGDDLLRGGPDGDTQKGGSGADTFIGSAEDFFGDRIIGFSKHDQIIVEGFDFNDITVEKGWFGQTEILFDTDADGEFDGSMRVNGFFGRSSFEVEQVDADVVITLGDDGPFGGGFFDFFGWLFDGWDFA
ncbi:MAG: hypothetical protein AAF414_09130 [Pseudomonadota bacterium]